MTSARTFSIRAVSARSRRANRSSSRSTSSALGVRAGEERVALPHLGRLQLDEALLVEVLERRQDPAALLAELRRGVVGRERRPGPARLARRDQAAQEPGARLVEAAEDAPPATLAERPQPVARVEGRSLPEHAVELEVGEDRLEHERAHVVAHGQLVLGDRELRADGMLEHLREQAGQRLARRRVAEGEVLQRGHVVRAREQLADALPRRRGRRGRSPASTSRGSSAGCSGRRSGRRPCRFPSRTRSSRRRSPRSSPPTTPAPRPVLGAHAGVVRPRRQPARRGARRSARRPLQRHVHDRRAGRTLAQPLDQQRVALAGCDRCRQQREIRPVEAGDDRVRLLDPEARADVRDDRRRRRRGERQHALGAELARPLGELQVVGPEVVAPLGDAVRLVDGEERDRRARELGEEALVVEPLRRDVEELQRAARGAARRSRALGGVEARVEPRGFDPAPLRKSI